MFLKAQEGSKIDQSFDAHPKVPGSGGGASSKAVAFCQSQARFKSLDGLGFFGSELLQIYSCWALGFFYRTRNRTVHTLLLLSCFLSPWSKFVNCKINNEPRKNKTPKRVRERPIFKKVPGPSQASLIPNPCSLQLYTTSLLL